MSVTELDPENSAVSFRFSVQILRSYPHKLDTLSYNKIYEGNLEKVTCSSFQSETRTHP